jgi:hypothetical protein
MSHSLLLEIFWHLLQEPDISSSHLHDRKPDDLGRIHCGNSLLTLHEISQEQQHPP